MITVYCQDPSFADSLAASKQHIKEDFKYKSLEDAGVKFVDDLKDAMVEISFKNGRAEFYTTDKRIIQHIGSRIPHDAAADDMGTIWKVLIALGRFNRFLDTVSDEFHNDVHIQLRKLKRDKLSGGLPSWFAKPSPTGENLIVGATTEGMDGLVDVEVDDAEYGVTLKNSMTEPEEDHDLYPYLVYFDACNLSIREFHSAYLLSFILNYVSLIYIQRTGTFLLYVQPTVGFPMLLFVPEKNSESGTVMVVQFPGPSPWKKG